MDSYRKIKDQIFTKNIGPEGQDMDIITDQVKKHNRRSQNRQIRCSRHNRQDKIDTRLENILVDTTDQLKYVQIHVDIP